MYYKLKQYYLQKLSVDLLLISLSQIINTPVFWLSTGLFISRILKRTFSVNIPHLNQNLIRNSEIHVATLNLSLKMREYYINYIK